MSKRRTIQKENVNNVAAAVTDGGAGLEAVNFPALFGASAQNQSSAPFSRGYPLNDGAGWGGTYALTATDRVGNASSAPQLDVVYDNSAPTLDLRLDSATGLHFVLGWTGTDGQSGVAAYDLEVRDGTGAWTALLSGTSATRADFVAQDGHKRLNTTLGYARAHDQTVADDYFTAMSRVEQRLELVGQMDEDEEPLNESEREQLLALATQFAQPELSLAARLLLVAQLRGVLLGGALAITLPFESINGRMPRDHPPPSSVLCGTTSV